MSLPALTSPSSASFASSSRSPHSRSGGEPTLAFQNTVPSPRYAARMSTAISKSCPGLASKLEIKRLALPSTAAASNGVRSTGNRVVCPPTIGTPYASDAARIPAHNSCVMRDSWCAQSTSTIANERPPIAATSLRFTITAQ